MEPRAGIGPKSLAKCFGHGPEALTAFPSALRAAREGASEPTCNSEELGENQCPRAPGHQSCRSQCEKQIDRLHVSKSMDGNRESFAPEKCCSAIERDFKDSQEYTLSPI